jgi:galactan 5-O-arabinofuranosyltransferase
MKVLIGWANDVLAGRALPKTYPPLPAHFLAWTAKIAGVPTGYAVKYFQIVGVAVVGPLAYLGWRLVLSPLPALVIGTVAAVVFAEPYKPYEEIVLVVLVPVLIRFVQTMREAEKHSWTWLIGVGVLLGAGLGVLFETYFGWFYWSALGAAAAVLLTFPWRQRIGRLRALAYLGAVCAAFALTTIENLPALVAGGVGRDTYLYFDVYSPPAYFAHWFNDTPPAGGAIVPWPPLGDLGGVALFVILLFAGLAVAVGFARDNSLVIVVGTFVASAWIMRFEIAQHMFATGTVGLWPRTDAQILYGLLVVTGFVVWHTARMAMQSELLSRYMGRWRSGGPIVGLLVGTLLLFASVGDATANAWMPGGGQGLLTNVSFTTPKLNGSCPKFTIRHSGECKLPVNKPLVGDLPNG